MDDYQYDFSENTYEVFRTTPDLNTVSESYVSDTV